MMNQIRILLIVALVSAAAFGCHKLGETAVKNQETQDLQEDEIVYIYDMSVEEISQYIRGKVFQRGSYGMAAGIGEVIYFAPEGNEYFWFCSSMDAQSRIRAEYGTWELEQGFMTTTTLKLAEWVNGHFSAAFGSTGSRFELEGFDEVLTEVYIESQSNFRMFKYLPYYSEHARVELGFYFIGREFYYMGNSYDSDALKKDYESYFSMFE